MRLTTNLHIGWVRLSRLPKTVLQCPRCKSPRSHKAHNWRWDEDAQSWLCTRPSCMDEPYQRRINRNVMQTLYAPPPR